MLRGETVKELYELKGQGRSIRGIARELGVSRNSVRKYMRSPGVPREKPRRRRVSKLYRYTDFVDRRLSEGLKDWRTAWCCYVRCAPVDTVAATRS